ncbi:MAG: alpha/beta hydrolase [Clostridia bacterium]|nr:alpha/beta hydrolase [Clostridia bacterium]
MEIENVNVREYGSAPHKAIVLHGGPGAPGSAAGICKGLCDDFGVLEHLQTSYSIDGLISEILDIYDKYGIEKTTIIGHSFGAWLALMFAEKYPEKVKKVIVVGCPPLEQKYLLNIIKTRNKRHKKVIHSDLYCPLPNSGSDMIRFDDEQFKALMDEATILRIRGKLLSSVLNVSRPIVAIHGDFDPHPIKGITKPIGGRLKNLEMIVLKKCGHEPWKEKYARDEFFNIVKEQIKYF